jgi:DNA-binding NarL/FixJ family response regulator
MRKNLIIVEPDPVLRAALLESLAPCSRELNPIAVADRAAAARLMAECRADLLVTDLGAPLMDGFVAACQLLRAAPEVPVLALAHQAAPQVSADLGANLRILRKPVDLDHFREQVMELLQRAPHGHLSGVSLSGFLQLLNMEARSGVLYLESSGGLGRLVVYEGELVDARTGATRGEEAAFRILEDFSRRQCEILVEELVEPVERTIGTPLMSLLLESARRHDDLDRDALATLVPDASGGC